MRVSRTAGIAFLVLGSIVGTAALALDVSTATPPSADDPATLNERTIGMIFPREPALRELVEELETELERDSDFRLVPMLGDSDVRSVYDLLYLEGVDAALVRSDAIDYVERVDGELAERDVHRIARVRSEKIVLVAGDDYTAVEQLAGELVSLGRPESGEFVSGTLLFDALGIEPRVDGATGDAAIERVRGGKIAAAVVLLDVPGPGFDPDDPSPVRTMASLGDAEGLNVIELPESEALSALYRPASLGSDELPGLIDPGETLRSYFVDVNLVAYAWGVPDARAGKLQRFVGTLVDRVSAAPDDVEPSFWTRANLVEQSPDGYRSSLVARAVAERERALRERALAEEAAAAEAEAERVKRLEERLETTMSRLGEALGEQELERMLDRLDTLLQNRRTVTPDPAAAEPTPGD